ncbi:MAG TPA: mechanosensitive ion channel family protein [Ilumatobacteraceae bacterium]|nr:mechanosensitive ion channel family protein [Ilumatobacteraceae bacterium]
MTASFEASNVLVAAIVIVVLPALIIGVGELEERLRQRDSSFGPSVAIVRVWVVPLAAVCVVIWTLFEIDTDRPLVRLLASGLVLAITAALLSAFRVIVDRIADRPRRSGHRSVPRLLLAVPRLLILLFASWWLIAGVWGVDLSSLLTALGVTSLVVSFALQDTLSGIASGFTLLADQPFSAGDWINSGEVEGRVIDVNWRSTRIEDRNGDLVVIPNGQLSKATIVNYDQPSRLHRVMVPVQIERTAPPTAAKAMLIDAARSTPGVVADPQPVVFVTNIADPVVDYQAYMWIDDYSITPRVRADFASLVWYLSYRHGVPLPNPAQDLYLFDGVQSAIESQVSPTDVRRALLDAPLLTETSDEILDRLAAASSIDTYQEGEVIIAPGNGRDVFVLADGRARLVLRSEGDVDLDVLDHGPGELIGVLGAVDDAVRTAVVVAASDCRVVRIPGDAAASALATSTGLAAALEQLGVSRRRRCERVLRRADRAIGAAADATGSDAAQASSTEDGS